MIPGDDGKPTYDLGDSSRTHPPSVPHALQIPVTAYPSADYRREPPTGPRASMYSAAAPPPPAAPAPLPAFAQAFPPDQQVRSIPPPNSRIAVLVRRDIIINTDI